MRPFIRHSFALFLLAGFVGACATGQQAAPPPVDTGAIEAGIDSLNQVFNAAVAARDTNAVVALYTDDALLMPAGAPRGDGQEALRQAWAGFLRTPGLSLSITSNKKMVSEAGDLAIDIGSYQSSMTGPKGKAIQDVGKYVTVLKKTAAGWKIAVDTFNSDQAPPGM